MHSIPRRMISRDDVQAIVTANGTAPTEATFPFLLEQSKVLIFATMDDPATEVKNRESVRMGDFVAA